MREDKMDKVRKGMMKPEGIARITHQAPVVEDVKTVLHQIDRILGMHEKIIEAAASIPMLKVIDSKNKVIMGTKDHPWNEL